MAIRRRSGTGWHGPRDGGTLGQICSGHFFSHFYMLVLPPLFPILKAEFGVSYTGLVDPLEGDGRVTHPDGKKQKFKVKR